LAIRLAPPLDELELDEPLVGELLEPTLLDELELDEPPVDELPEPGSLDEIVEATLDKLAPDELGSPDPVPESHPATLIASATVTSHAIVRISHSLVDRTVELTIARSSPIYDTKSRSNCARFISV
jgi:hypothetical protein